MSTSETAPKSTRNPTAFLGSPLDRVALFGLIGLLPLLLIQASHLWARPHFQFFPIAWGAFAWLAYSRGRLETTHSKLRLGLGVSGLIAAGAAAVVAVCWYSPWLAHLSLVLLLLGWMFVRFGGNAWYQPVSWLTLLVVSLPLPMNYDSRLVQQLQASSSASASALLDLSSVPHLAQGNIIEIRSGRLFVDEACSGVDSLYALTAVGLLLTIWFGKSLLVSLLSLATVPAWAWLGNLIRIYTIAFVFDRYGIDWTHGWQHTLLGLVVFGGLVVALLSTMEAFTRLLTPFPVLTVTSVGVHTLYNRIACWPGADPAAPPEKATPAPVTSPLVLSARFQSAVRYAAFLFLVIGLASFFPVLGVGPWREPIVIAHEITPAEVRDHLPVEVLPADLGGMRRIGYELHEREVDSFFGEHSATWQYADGDYQVLISIDFPFAEFHNLEICYEMAGSERVEAIEEHVSGSEGEPLYIYDTVFADQFGEGAYLCYTEFTPDGEAASRGLVFERGIFRNSSQRALFQAQIYVTGVSVPKEEQQARYRELLERVKGLVLPHIQQL